MTCVDLVHAVSLSHPTTTGGRPRRATLGDVDAFDPATTYLHLATGPEVRTIPVTDDFWPTIEQRTDLRTGRLMTGVPVTSAWDTWEMHPAGDEIIAVTAGSVRFHLDDGEHTSEVTVSAPDYIVVPAGTWHTADDPLDRPARLLVITWGEGTTTRPR